MDFSRIVDWYKYILKFSPIKFLALAIMIGGPLYFIYRRLFIGFPMNYTLIGCAASLIIGAIIFQLGWDSYA